MTDQSPRVSLHRFHDCAALSVLHNPDGHTVYLTAREARQLARDMNRLARSLERESFGASRFAQDSVATHFTIPQN